MHGKHFFISGGKQIFIAAVRTFSCAASKTGGASPTHVYFSLGIREEELPMLTKVMMQEIQDLKLRGYTKSIRTVNDYFG